MIPRLLLRAAPLIALAAVCAPSSARALEPLVLYEDWSDGLIRAHRWQGSGAGGLEVKRSVTPAGTLLLRYRREGATTSDTGSSANSTQLNFPRPADVNQVEAVFTVNSLTMTTCPANNTGAATRARPARILMAKFNDGTLSIPGDATGDYVAGVQARRDGSATTAGNVLTAEGFVVRCTNPTCGTSSSVFSTTLADGVTVGQTFTLRLKWDEANSQFLAGFNNAPDVAMPYAIDDSTPANNYYVIIGSNHTTAACLAGPTAVDTTTSVGAVRTNESAVAP